MSNNNQETEAFYQRLKLELEKKYSEPFVYMFKFILPADSQNLHYLEHLFDNEKNVEIIKKNSKNNKYIAISITTTMKNPDAVIDKYRQASCIKGIIAI